MRTAPSPVTPGASISSSAEPGVLDLYRAIGAALVNGWSRVAWVAEAGFIAAWFILRFADVERAPMLLWTVAAALLAIAAPTSGLVVIAATAPFNEGLLLSRDVGAKPALLAIVVVSVAVRVALGYRALRRPPASILLAGFLLVGTAAGLAVTRDRFGDAFFASAAQIWFTGIATAFLAFIAAAWVARNGELRPMWVAVGSAVAAIAISFVEYVDPDGVRAGAVAWAISGEPFLGRMTGVMRSPTAVATLVLLPICLAVAAAVLGRRPRVRLAGVAFALPLLVAAYVTYSRAVFLVLFALAVAIAWRVRRRYGIGLLAAGLVIGALLLPSYMDLRNAAVGNAPEQGQVLLANDRQRLTAWATSVRLFVDSPLIGQGYRAYREVAPAFGDTTLNAPHNEWLRLFAEHGAIVGLAGVAFVAVTARRLWRLDGWLGVGIFGAFIAFALAACFNNPFLFNQVTIVAFIIAGTGIALAGRLSPALAARTEASASGATGGP